MVTKPDSIVNKSAKSTQETLTAIAILAGIIGLALLGNGHGVGLLPLIGAVGLGFAASKIKTTYHHRGGVDVYK